MNFGVIQFPGSNCDQDCMHVIKTVLGQNCRYIWHAEKDVGNLDVIILPGGFSYGDYLRTGAIARFSPVMQEVIRFADNGGLVIGICNGFQILCEAGLLPGALVRNRSVQFRCEHVFLKTLNYNTPFTCKIPKHKPLRIPIAHGEGCYYADQQTIENLKMNGQILWQYVDCSGQLTEAANPNGSLENIAGICNKSKNVVGLMPHPERASEEILGSTDGKYIFESIIAWIGSRQPAAV